MTESYDHIDLFSGIGGFTLGLHQAGLNINKLYFSEINTHAISVYRRQFPDAEYLGSVDTISGRGLTSGKSIVTFGFPCQDLSVAGKRKGFDGSRSSLFFEAMRIIEELRPDIFIFENVKGFYSSNDGKDFTIALQTIADLGLYECQWQLLNTAWFLPQNRERIYFVGSLGIGNRRKIFPIRNSNTEIQKKGYGKGDYAGCLSTKNASGQCNFDGSTTLIGDFRHDEGIRIRDNGNCPTLKANHSPGDISKAPFIFNKHWFRTGERGNGIDEKAFTMDSGCGNDQLVNMIRRLTPIECERLQGFPDNWTQYGHDRKLISDTQRYKMCGNAVSVPVVREIGRRIKLNKAQITEA